LGGIGIGLKRKFVKQTKVNSGFAHERGLDQVTLIEAQPDEGTGGTRVLGKADAALVNWTAHPAFWNGRLPLPDIRKSPPVFPHWIRNSSAIRG